MKTYIYIYIGTGGHGRSNTGKDEEEGGDELNDEGLNAVGLDSLSGGSQSDFSHGYAYLATTLPRLSVPPTLITRLGQ